MNKSASMNRPTLLTSIALAGAFAALVVALLSLAPPARGGSGSAALYPRTIKLTDSKIAHWAGVMRRAVVRSKPGLASRIVTTLPTGTTDDTQNIVLVLSRVDISPHQSWYRVRLPILPNNKTGYVQGRYLSSLFVVHTHLYVDRGSLTATLKRDGKTIFKTIVGVGRSYWPTPAGEFYIRDKLTNFNNPFYGPVAFGTSARSPTLTDWPGGGYVGVHGTNEPGILPGHVSHGCIRMRNPAILTLARLMPVGTPLTIR
jgi:L,D-transpeptidase-like protein/SH3 domain-containing protein